MLRWLPGLTQFLAWWLWLAWGIRLWLDAGRRRGGCLPASHEHNQGACRGPSPAGDLDHPHRVRRQRTPLYAAASGEPVGGALGEASDRPSPDHDTAADVTGIHPIMITRERS
jgi:hypothetical protein